MKHSCLLSPIVNYEENVVLCIQQQGPYSQHFATNEQAPKARVFVTDKPIQPSVMKQSSFLDPFISYEENGVL